MCNPALIGLGLMAVGTAASYAGQRQGARAAQRVASGEEATQRKLRQKSLAAASQTIDAADPAHLGVAIAGPQNTLARSQRDASTIAAAAAQGGAPGAVGGQIFDSAVGDAGRTLAPMATRQGFSQGLNDQELALQNLAQQNLFLNEDSRRSLSTLDQRLARAGRRGSSLRLVGQLANTAGGAMTGGALWGAKPGGGSVPNTGLGRTARSRGGFVPEN